MRRARPGWTRIPGEEAPLFLFPWSALNRFVSFQLARHLQTDGLEEIPLDYLVYGVNYDAEWEAAWQRTEKLLLQTRNGAAGIGARYMVVSASTPHGVIGQKDGLDLLRGIYPAMEDRDFDLDKPDSRLEAFCKEKGIPFLALEPLFRKVAKEKKKKLHWRYNGHWNGAGNDLAGRLIAEFILGLT